MPTKKGKILFYNGLVVDKKGKNEDLLDECRVYAIKDTDDNQNVSTE